MTCDIKSKITIFSVCSKLSFNFTHLCWYFTTKINARLKDIFILTHEGQSQSEHNHSHGWWGCGSLRPPSNLFKGCPRICWLNIQTPGEKPCDKLSVAKKLRSPWLQWSVNDNHHDPTFQHFYADKWGQHPWHLTSFAQMELHFNPENSQI